MKARDVAGELAPDLRQAMEDVRRDAFIEAFQTVRVSPSIEVAVETLKIRAQACGVDGTQYSLPKASGQ